MARFEVEYVAVEGVSDSKVFSTVIVFHFSPLIFHHPSEILPKRWRKMSHRGQLWGTLSPNKR